MTSLSVPEVLWKSKLSCFCTTAVGEAVEAAARELRAQRIEDPLAVAEHAGGEKENSTRLRSPWRSPPDRTGHRLHCGPRARRRWSRPAMVPRGAGTRPGRSCRGTRPHRPARSGSVSRMRTAMRRMSSCRSRAPPSRRPRQAHRRWCPAWASAAACPPADPRMAGTPGVLQADGRIGHVHRPCVEGWASVGAAMAAMGSSRESLAAAMAARYPADLRSSGYEHCGTRVSGAALCPALPGATMARLVACSRCPPRCPGRLRHSGVTRAGRPARLLLSLQRQRPQCPARPRSCTR